MYKFFLLFALFVFCLPAQAQNHTIQQYLNIRSASSPALSTDGKRLAYLTNTSGTSQVWMKDLPNGDAKQITNYEDNVSFVRWSPSGKSLVFGKARGGDENTQFFLMSNDGASIKPLTDNPKVRHNFGGFSDDGARIYYASNKRDKNFFDVYAMDLGNGKEELLYHQDGSNSFAAASKDGKQIVVSRSGTELSLDNNLYLIDVESKKETLLTPHKDASSYGDVDFLPDGKTIVFSTDQDREFATLATMFLDSAAAETASKIETVNTGIWDVEGVEVSPRGDYIAHTNNLEGFSRLSLRKIETSKEPKASRIIDHTTIINLPAKGIVGGLSFSGDGGKLAFTFNSAKNNSDIWIWDLKQHSKMQATKSDRAGIAQDSFVEPQLIKYKSFDGREIPAWYYTQKGYIKSVSFSPGSSRPIKGVLPVIVSVHGGPEGQERPGFNPLYQYYLSRGYAILATNVRGSTGYGKTFTHLDDVRKREDSVKDLAYAVEWLKTTGGADGRRIAVMGGSYGGYMTLAAITLYPDLFAAAVNTVGIANWETFLKNTSGYRRRQREVEYGRLDKDLDFLKSISPLSKVDKIKTPLFVIHGRNDPRVPYTEAEQIVESLQKRRARVEYKLFADEGHGISKLKNRLELYPLVADFLDRYMK